MPEGQDVQFVGALSFEPRALGALTTLGKRQRRLSAVLLDYGSEATPGAEAARRRNRQWELARDICASMDWQVKRLSCDPYSMTSLTEVVQQCASTRVPGDRLVVDVSCMTKAHVIAAAVALGAHGPSPWTVAYASPNNYGDVQKGLSAGLRGTLTLPIGVHPSLANEGLSLGLLLPGAEAGRAFVAFEELGPGAGIISLVTRADRPDFHDLTFGSNSSLFDYLASLRLSGKRVSGSEFSRMWPSLGWEFAETPEESLVAGLSLVVSRLIEGARLLDAPVIFYPFGPKDSVFSAAFLLNRDYPERSWAIYPVLGTHTLDYSEGIGLVRWLSDEDFTASLSFSG